MMTLIDFFCHTFWLVMIYTVVRCSYKTIKKNDEFNKIKGDIVSNLILEDKFNLVDENNLTFINRIKGVIIEAFLNEDIELTNDNNMNYISVETMEIIKMIYLERFESLIDEFNDLYITNFYKSDIEIILNYIQERSSVFCGEFPYDFLMSDLIQMSNEHQETYIEARSSASFGELLLKIKGD